MARRSLTDAEKKAISRRMKRMWRKKRQENGKTEAVAAPVADQVHAQLTERAKKCGVRLVAYGVNPNTGAVELHMSEKLESMRDGLQPIIDLLYSGHPMTEIRLEEVD